MDAGLQFMGNSLPLDWKAQTHRNKSRTLTGRISLPRMEVR